MIRPSPVCAGGGMGGGFHLSSAFPLRPPASARTSASCWPPRHSRAPWTGSAATGPLRPGRWTTALPRSQMIGCLASAGGGGVPAPQLAGSQPSSSFVCLAPVPLIEVHELTWVDKERGREGTGTPAWLIQLAVFSPPPQTETLSLMSKKAEQGEEGWGDHRQPQLVVCPMTPMV